MALLPIKLIPAETHVNFVGLHKLAALVSLFAVIASLFLAFSGKLNLGIDFSGGILIEARFSEEADLQALRRDLASPLWGEPSLQGFENPRDVLIRLEMGNAGDEQAALVEQIKQAIANKDAGVEFRKIDFVGPTVGNELIESGALALVLAMGAMMLYIWIRFEWQFGLGGMIALMHDAILVVGFYAISGYEFSLTSIAAILTVIGYSINDSVVIYDRIRENLRKYKKMPPPELLNLSMNETLSRTVVTGLTTILASLVLAVFGGDVLEGFAAALVFGVIVGTYSSLFIAAPFLLYFDMRSLSESTTSDDAPQAG